MPHIEDLRPAKSCYYTLQAHTISAGPMRLRIKEVREELGVSQTELATALGVSKGYMSQLENGKRRLNLETQIEIAKFLCVPAETLVDFDAPEKAESDLVLQAFQRADKSQRQVILSIARSILDSDS